MMRVRTMGWLGAPGDPVAPPAPAKPSGLPPGVRNLTREQLAAAMKAAPSPETLGSADDLAFLVANADLVRDDWGDVIVQVADATNVGKKRTLMKYAIGAAVGAAVGALAYKLIGG
jgi:hypothetical protein